MSKKDFLVNINKETNYTTTSNGAITNKSSLNALLDFFGQAGSMRQCSPDAITKLFDAAYKEDALRAIKCVFYIGDILKGQGERRTFRILLTHIANNYTEDLRANIDLIPEYNRWDSIYSLFDTPLENDAISLIKKQLKNDLKSDTPSLCAKWLKSLKTSSKQSRLLAKKTARLLNLNDFKNINSKSAIASNNIAYRVTLSTLRSRLKLIEKSMSTNHWDSIDYSSVPSKAMNIYSNAFYKHDSERFEKYIEDVTLHNATINSKTLYPYEIVKKILNGKVKTNMDKKVAEIQWNALPNFIKNEDMKGLCVVDVSASMNGTPLEVAISTGLYVSERCTGVYKNKFITFSAEPELVSVTGSNIVEKVRYMNSANWGYNTNLEAVFDLILQTAIKHKAPQSDIPDYLIIITDMGFDSLQQGSGYGYIRDADKQIFHKETFIQTMKGRFEEWGYKLPILVLWNVNANGGQMPMTADEFGWISISGYSPSIFTALLSEELLGAQNLQAENIDPVKAMLTVLDSERYNKIVI